jgi:ribosomal-protein-alanine N-acetyltransferase
MTDRLILRNWSAKDIENATLLWGDPEVMALVDIRGGLSREQVFAKLQNEILCQQKNGVQYWPVYKKADDSFVGCCGLKPWVLSPLGGHELGFHLLREAWGKGYAFEAAQAVIGYARENKFSHLLAGHHPENLNSKKILEKLGFRYVEKVFFPPTGLMHPSYKISLILE